MKIVLRCLTREFRRCYAWLASPQGEASQSDFVYEIERQLNNNIAKGIRFVLPGDSKRKTDFDDGEQNQIKKPNDSKSDTFVITLSNNNPIAPNLTQSEYESDADTGS